MPRIELFKFQNKKSPPCRSGLFLGVSVAKRSANNAGDADLVPNRQKLKKIEVGQQYNSSRADQSHHTGRLIGALWLYHDDVAPPRHFAMHRNDPLGRLLVRLHSLEMQYD
jgi:hypothetical protein